MNNREKKVWIQQLSMLSKQIESMDGDAGAQNLVTAAASLACQIAEKTSGMSAKEQELLLPAFCQLAEACEIYSGAAASGIADASSLESVKKALKTVEDEAQGLKGNLELMREAVTRQRDLNDSIEKTLGQQRDLFEAEKARTEKIRSELEQYTPGKLDEIRRETKRLSEELQKKSSIRDSLESERRTREDELRLANERNEAVQSAIDTYSEDTRKAYQTYKEKTEELHALETADVDCSPEKQAELSEKIEKLKPGVDKKAAEMKILKTEYENLQEMHTLYEKERAALTSNVFDIIHDRVNALSEAVGEQKNELYAVEKKAKLLHENMKKAAEQRDELKDWFDMERTPLEAMCAGVSGPDREMLKKELDPGKIGEVRELVKEIEGQINKLDIILERCFKAAAVDKENLRKKTPR